MSRSKRYQYWQDEIYKRIEAAKAEILNSQWENELADRIAQRVMFSVDTAEAVGKIRELNNLINSIGE